MDAGRSSIGGLVVSVGRRIVGTDVADVWTITATRAELLLARQRGQLTLLLAHKLDVSYGQLQVLFGVDLAVDEGEIVALLGTNGAGKSTILKAICGLASSSGGIRGRRGHLLELGGVHRQIGHRPDARRPGDLPDRLRRRSPPPVALDVRKDQARIAARWPR